MQLSKAARVIGTTMIGAVVPLVIGFLPMLILFLIGASDKQIPAQEWMFLGGMAIGLMLLGAFAGVVIGAFDMGLLASVLMGFIPAFLISIAVIALVGIGLRYASPGGQQAQIEVVLGIIVLVALISAAGIISGLACGTFVKLTRPKNEPGDFSRPPAPPKF